MELLSRKLIVHAIVFFLYGALVHLLLLRVYARHAYAEKSKPEFLSDPSIYATVAFMGGLCVATLFFLLLKSALSSEHVRVVWFVGRAGGFGIVATILTVAGSSVAGAAMLTGHLTANVLLKPWLFAFSTMSIGTYAMGAAVASAPFAFLYGAIGGVYALVLSRQLKQPVKSEGEQPLAPGTLSLVFGILGLFFVFIPFVGLILGVLAVLYGFRSGAWKQVIDARANPFFAKTGTVIGVLCIFYWAISVAVYIAAGFGWLRR